MFFLVKLVCEVCTAFNYTLNKKSTTYTKGVLKLRNIRLSYE